MQRMLAEPAAPEIAPGGHCFTPYLCPYHEHCTGDMVAPEHGIDELPRLTASRRAALEAAGVEEIRDIPENFPLTRLQRIVRRAVREDRAVVHGDIARALAEIAPPVRHLDFEAFAPAIPRIAGTSPYEQIPFLFSVHTERDGSPPEQAELGRGSDLAAVEPHLHLDHRSSPCVSPLADEDRCRRYCAGGCGRSRRV